MNKYTTNLQTKQAHHHQIQIVQTSPASVYSAAQNACGELPGTKLRDNNVCLQQGRQCACDLTRFLRQAASVVGLSLASWSSEENTCAQIRFFEAWSNRLIPVLANLAWGSGLNLSVCSEA